MMLLSILAIATGRKSWTSIIVDILLLAAIGAWLWWRRSMIAAGLMAALVAFEYYVLAP